MDSTKAFFAGCAKVCAECDDKGLQVMWALGSMFCRRARVVMCLINKPNLGRSIIQGIGVADVDELR